MLAICLLYASPLQVAGFVPSRYVESCCFCSQSSTPYHCHSHRTFFLLPVNSSPIQHAASIHRIPDFGGALPVVSKSELSMKLRFGSESMKGATAALSLRKIPAAKVITLIDVQIPYVLLRFLLFLYSLCKSHCCFFFACRRFYPELLWLS